jgi:hypothetical protein
LTRYAPDVFAERLDSVAGQVLQTLDGSPCELRVTTEAPPSVRLVKTQQAGSCVVLTLWTQPRDTAETCREGAYASSAGLLAIDRAQVVRLGVYGMVLDLAQLVHSETMPGLSNTLIDQLDEDHLRNALGCLLAGGMSTS